MFIQKIVLSYSSKIIIQVIQMIATLIVARIVGPGVIGTLAYGLAFVSMFSFIADLGTGTAHMRLIAAGNDESKCVGTYLRIKLILSTAFVFIVTFALLYTKYFSGSGFESSEQEIIIFIYLIIIAIGQFTGLYSTTWAAHMEQAKQDVPQFLQTVLYQILRILIAILGFKAIGLALGNLMAALITIPLYLFLGRSITIGKFDKVLFKHYISISLPVVVLGICQVLIFSVDKVYLQSQTDLVMLGNYSAAVGLAVFIKTIESSVGLLLFPLFSSYIVEKNFDRINSVIKKYELITIGFILPAIVTLSIFSNAIISILYGHKFTEAAPVFSIIVFSYFTSMILLPYGNLLFGLGKFKETAWLWIIAVAFFFMTAYGLVSRGMLNLKGAGMAMSLLLTNLVLLIFTIFLIKKYLNDQIKIIPGIKLIFFVFIYFSVLLLFVYKFLPDGLIYQTIIACCAYLLFLLLGRILNIIRKEDLLMIKEIFNLRKMKSYVKNELKRK